MANLNEKAIREAAYYIWKNAGCPSNTSAQDWNAALNQLSSCSCSKNSSNKTSSCAASTMKKTASKAPATKVAASKTTSKKSK